MMPRYDRSKIWKGIPFEGFLQVKDSDEPRMWFAVMIKGFKGYYTAGELFYKDEKWELTLDSVLAKYVEDLGNIAALWQDCNHGLHRSGYDI